MSPPRFPVQTPREVEHFVRDPDLAHVVHQTGEVGDVLIPLGKLHGLGDVRGPARDGGRVAGGVVVLDVQSRHLALDSLEEQFLVTQSQRRVGLSQLPLVGEGPEGVDEAQHREEADDDQERGVELRDAARLEGVVPVDVDEAQGDGQEEEVEGEEWLKGFPPEGSAVSSCVGTTVSAPQSRN